MDEKNIRRAKWFNYLVFWLVILLIGLAGMGVYRYATRPLAQWLTVDGLRTNVAQMPRVEGRLEGKRFEKTCTDEFSGLFRWEEWEKTTAFPTEDPILTIFLADEYDMEFYENGKVYVFDGYAPSEVVGEGYYQIPEGVLTGLISYLE